MSAIFLLTFIYLPLLARIIPAKQEKETNVALRKSQRWYSDVAGIYSFWPRLIFNNFSEFGHGLKERGMTSFGRSHFTLWSLQLLQSVPLFWERRPVNKSSNSCQKCIVSRGKFLDPRTKSVRNWKGVPVNWYRSRPVRLSPIQDAAIILSTAIPKFGTILPDIIFSSFEAF